MVLEGRQPVYGGWSMKVSEYMCFFICVSIHNAQSTVYACVAGKGFWCLKKMHQDQHQWVQLVSFSLTFLFFSPSICSKTPIVITTSTLCRGFKNKHHIFRSYLCVGFRIATLWGEWFQCKSIEHDEMWKTKQTGKLSRCYHTFLFTVHFLLSNVLSWLVTPMSKIAVQTFSIPCHCSWYIDIKCTVECHKMCLL